MDTEPGSLDPRRPEGIEDSLDNATSSNARLGRAWELLGAACGSLAGADAPTYEPVLEAALDATQSERAFVVVQTKGCAHTLASRSRRRDGAQRPSQTVVRRVMAAGGPLVCPDANADRLLAGELSVRSLSLRCVLGTSIPQSMLPEGVRGALILDSRVPGAALRPQLAQLLLAFASLTGLLLACERNRGAARLGQEPSSPRADDDEPDPIGRSPAFIEMMDWVRRVAPYDVPVLIRGESGSGKEGIARALHRASPRRRGPFLGLNCAAFPETLLESELFGAVRGAYTGSDRDRPGLLRQAQGGTLLLDEIGDMPLPMQAKLLRVLQQRRARALGGDRELPFDVRVVAATHRDLREEIVRGSFRPDLFHRIAVVEVRVPPLRERLEDLPLLAQHLAERIARRTGLSAARLAPCALERLKAFEWPGNVRELEAVLVRGMLRAGTGVLTAAHLDAPESTRPTPAPAVDTQPLEHSMITWALRTDGNNIARAAARIGWSRQKLYRRMAALGIDRHQQPREPETPA